MLELVAHYGRGPVPVTAVAAQQGISAKYIHQLMIDLRAAGLVRAVRGPGGGYELARGPAVITAQDVVAALEGDHAPVACVKDAGSCPRSRHCAVRDVWCDVAAAVDEVLSGLTLEQLADRQRTKKHQAADYNI